MAREGDESELRSLMVGVFTNVVYHGIYPMFSKGPRLVGGMH